MFHCKYSGSLPMLCKLVGRTGIRRLVKNERCLFTPITLMQKDEKPKPENEITGSIASKYEVFIDEKSPVIFDIEQEREKFYEVNDESGRAEKKKIDFIGINPKAGATGVIDVDELVHILKKENATDILVIKIPDVYCYVEYLVVVTSRSARHMQAIAEFVRRVYKFKVSGGGKIPDIEGKDSNTWKALDLGNIALHIMSKSSRELYDLDSLWAVGKEYDLKSRKENVSESLCYENILSNFMPMSNQR